MAFDCRYINPDSLDGIGRFSAKLFSAVSKRIRIAAIISDTKQLELLPDGTEFVMLGKPTSAMEVLASIRLRRHGFETVFSPMQTIGSLGKRFRLILTVHDLIYYSHPTPPRQFNPLIRILWRIYHTSFLPQRLLLSRADEVVTVSKTTFELMRKHKLTDKRITVVPNASDGLRKIDVPVEKKLVYMGSFLPYKNVEELILGTSLLNDFKLVLLSRISKKDRQRLQKLADESGVEVVFENGVSDEQYAYHLCSATALVHASADEGFGIPIVEALSVGCPVVCSDIPIFREIADSAGFYFEIGNRQQFAQQVERASADRSAMEGQLIAQANRFNWDKSAMELAKLLTRG